MGKDPDVGKSVEELNEDKLGWREKSQVVALAQSEVRQPDPNRESEGPSASLLPRPPVILTCQGLPFIILRSPARLPAWGHHPLGEAITTWKPNQSSYHIQDTRLRIIHVFFKPSEMQTHIYVEEKINVPALSTREVCRPQLSVN